MRFGHPKDARTLAAGGLSEAGWRAQAAGALPMPVLQGQGRQRESSKRGGTESECQLYPMVSCRPLGP